MHTRRFPLRLTASLSVLGIMAILLLSSMSRVSETPDFVSIDFRLPGSISLCDEPVPLEKTDVWENLDREFTIAVSDKAQVLLWLKRAGRYLPSIEEKLAEEGMPDDLKYLAVAESALITDIRSSEAAVGLWQFMARTGRQYGLRKDYMVDERLDFERATEAALKHLRRLRDIFGSWTLALAAYNCGEGLLNKEIRRQKVDDFYSLMLPTETERSVFRIAAIKIIMENPERYGYYLTREQVYQPLKYDAVYINIHKALHLADVALALETDYRVLKELNPQILAHHLPAGRYPIKVPPGFGGKMATVVSELTSIASAKTDNVPVVGHYVIQEGDTLGHIARKMGVSVAALRNLNRMEGSKIRPGQMLQLTP